ncbi:MAG: polyamine aminopropyltransferase [SAR202 cluster bacterium]|nr:polyamine aminopropyltransferase [SAR202 cluster bacterium]|tara:strand:- start:2439 stop:3347 length:909 start_codon:yes stop_codon:yes gene_type:complete
MNNNYQWHSEIISEDLKQLVQVEDEIFSFQTKFQNVLIQRTSSFGTRLLLDNKTQSTELDEFIYHESLVHPSLIFHSNPKSVFVAGGGEGATIREILRYQSVENVTMVDIDEEVVKICQQYLPKHSSGAFDDPRLDLNFDDALIFLKKKKNKYDVMIIDLPDPLEDGPAIMLYTKEFYELLKNRLNPGGIIVTQAGPTGPILSDQCFNRIAKTMKNVFPETFVYESFVPSFVSTWGFVIGSLESKNLSVSEIDSKLLDQKVLDLKYYDGITHQGMFSLSIQMRNVLSEDVDIITSQNPLIVK